jgi:hypothetical protein
MPEAEIAVLSPAEVAFRGHGLEFARAAAGTSAWIISQHERNCFWLGARREGGLRKEFRRVCTLDSQHRRSTSPQGPRDHFLWRMHPERWLESLVVKQLGRFGYFPGRELSAEPPLLFLVAPASAHSPGNRYTAALSPDIEWGMLPLMNAGERASKLCSGSVQIKPHTADLLAPVTEEATNVHQLA